MQPQCIQAASPPHQAEKTQANPIRNIVCKSAPNLHTVPLYEIIKDPERVAVATKYLPCSSFLLSALN